MRRTHADVHHHPTVFDFFEVRTARKIPRTSRERFEQFHSDNPVVYDLLRGFALQALHAGQRLGIRAIWERMRWELRVVLRHREHDAYKLNDHYTSHYSRLLMSNEPELRDFFEIRERERERKQDDGGPR